VRRLCLLVALLAGLALVPGGTAAKRLDASRAAVPSGAAKRLDPRILVLELWSFPTAEVTAFKEITNKAIPGVDGWQTRYRANATTGPIVVHSTAQVFPSAGAAHRALANGFVAGRKLVDKGGTVPTTDVKWTVVWGSTRVLANITFTAA
jgi:hypothetical protein